MPSALCPSVLSPFCPSALSPRHPLPRRSKHVHWQRARRADDCCSACRNVPTRPDHDGARAGDHGHRAPFFAEFLTGVRTEALSRGIRKEIVDAALEVEEPMPIVLERDRTQAETSCRSKPTSPAG